MTKYTLTKRSKLGYLKDDEGNDIAVQEVRQIRNDSQKRNKPCNCNSGKKFKDCCNPAKKENDNRWAARMFSTEVLGDNQNVKAVGISGSGDIYVLLNNDYQEYYPETYECEGETYMVHVQFSTSPESQD